MTFLQLHRREKTTKCSRRFPTEVKMVDNIGDLNSKRGKKELRMWNREVWRKKNPSVETKGKEDSRNVKPSEEEKK